MINLNLKYSIIFHPYALPDYITYLYFLIDVGYKSPDLVGRIKDILVLSFPYTQLQHVYYWHE